MSDEQDAKKLIELQEILKRKIIETKNAAE
jgi:hypothetical protein